jgi:hypothetical protein
MVNNQGYIHLFRSSLGVIPNSICQDTSSPIQCQNNKHEWAAIVQFSRNCQAYAKLAGVSRRDKDQLGIQKKFSAMPLSKKQTSAKTKTWDQWSIAELAIKAWFPCPLSLIYTLSKYYMFSHGSCLRTTPPESVTAKHHMYLHHMIPPETSTSV